jgi:single-strand DNA-binding protein
MPDVITLTGLVATTPRHVLTSESLAITSFRLASTQRRYDKAQSRWIDGETNWYTITGFRQLALNAASSIHKGDRVVVTGKLKIRDWENGERTGTTIEIEAEALGHDLSWGTSAFARSVSASTTDAADAPSGEPGTVVELAETAASDTPDVETGDSAFTAPADEATPLDSVPVPF